MTKKGELQAKKGSSKSKTVVKKVNQKTEVSTVKKENNNKEIIKEVPNKAFKVVSPKATKEVSNSITKNKVNDMKENKKSIGQRVFDVVFWVVLCTLAFIWIVDFINVKKGNEPKFCVKTVIHQYTDGIVTECKGLGYNVYNYNRTSKNIKIQFSPFFIGIEK